MEGIQTRNPATTHLNGRLLFLHEFLKHPLQIGSIVPSSRFLERRIVATARIASAQRIVELGPGTGGTTRALLRAMPKQAKLLSIEINPLLHARLIGVGDNRLITHLGSACDLRQILEEHSFDAPDAVVSGIPFSTMSRDIGSRILEAVTSVLAANGRFVAYQVSNRVAVLCRPYMGREQRATELRNVPPMRIFQWQKRSP